MCKNLAGSRVEVLEWIAILSPGDLPNPGMEPRSPALQADSLPSESPGKPRVEMHFYFSLRVSQILTVMDLLYVINIAHTVLFCIFIEIFNDNQNLLLA